MDTVKPDLDSYVAQPYSLSRASYSMPMRYRKLLHAAMMHAQITAGAGASMEFRVSDLVRVFSKNDDSGKAYKQFRLDSFSDELMKLILKIEKENGDWDKYTWVDHCHYSREKDTLTIVISPKLLPLVLDYRKRYTVVTLEEITKFQGRHAWRYYEIFCTEKFRAGTAGNKKNQFFVQMTLDEIRTRLVIEKDEYKMTSDLRKKAVDAPVREINNLDIGIYVDAIPLRCGKRLEGFRFVCTLYGPGIGPKPQSVETPQQAEEKNFLDSHIDRFNEILEELIRSEGGDCGGANPFAANFLLRQQALDLLKAEVKQ